MKENELPECPSCNSNKDVMQNLRDNKIYSDYYCYECDKDFNLNDLKHEKDERKWKTMKEILLKHKYDYV